MWCSSPWRRPTPSITRSCQTLTDPPVVRTTTTPASRMASQTEGRGTACQEVRNSGGKKKEEKLVLAPCVYPELYQAETSRAETDKPDSGQKKMQYVVWNSPKPDSIFTPPPLSLFNVCLPLFATHYRNAGFQLPQQQQLWDHSGAQLWQVPQRGNAQELLGPEPQLAGQLHRAGRCECSRSLKMCFLMLVNAWLSLGD